MILFYVTSSSWQGDVFSLTGVCHPLTTLFEIEVEKTQPKDPIPLQELVSHEGDFAVYDGEFLWRVRVSMEFSDSATDHPPPPHSVPDNEFSYHEHGLPAVVYAHITGALAAWL